MTIPKILEPKFNARICTMCDNKVGEFRDHESRTKYEETGYCQRCIDMEFGDLPDQGTTSINWENCLRRVLIALPNDAAAIAIDNSGLSEEDKEELRRIIA